MKRVFPCLLLFLGAWIGASAGARGATWYLQNGATGDWNTLSNWNSLPLGGGTAPTAISSSDNFDLNGFGVNTPKLSSGTTTFHGNELIMHGGLAGLINTKTNPTATIAIPTLVSDGGFINCALPGVIPIDITTFTNNSNTTLNGNGSGLGLNFTIGTLSGAGDLCAIGTGKGSAGGVVLFGVTTATAFTGTLHIANGCQFTFENTLTSGGALEVEGAGTVVTLNTTVTFAGLTINGVVVAAGTYPATTLGGPFTGSGSVVVLPASIQANTVKQQFGVNLPGGGFDSGAFYPKDPNEFSYYQGKKLNLLRVAFLWERVQPTLGGPLSTSALASLDAAVALAASRGMQVMLDMHNYDRYNVSGTAYVVGSTQVPYSQYQYVWQLLAAHFAGEPGIYGYDIMNEPNGDNGTWNSTTAQTGVNGVRLSDTSHYVVVEGDNNAGGQAWMSNNQTLNVTDPANKLIYSAHTYWDSNDSGAYSGSYDSNNDYPNVGLDRIASFIYWLNLKGARGLVGEFGVPNNVSNPDYRWNNVLDNFLYYLNNNGVGGTYWAGGESWGRTYTLSCATGTPPVDAPAMAVLESYGSTATLTSGTPPVPVAGTAYDFAFQVSDYPSPVFTVASGTLPPGLALSTSGVLSGTPAQSGAYTFSISAGNGEISIASQGFTVNVQDPPPTATDSPTMPPWALVTLGLLLLMAIGYGGAAPARN